MSGCKENNAGLKELEQFKLATRREAAWMLSISERTLDRMVGRGVIPAIKIGTKSIRFDMDEVKKHVQGGGANDLCSCSVK